MSGFHGVRAAAVAAAALVAACAPTTNPVTGQQDYTVVSPRQEQQIGAREHPKVLAAYGGEYADPKVSRYVKSIGARLAAQSETPNIGWTFTVLDSPVVNAFALPGGYVYVSRGLVALANDEAQLAGVIGHEIGHVTARHTAQRQTRATVAQGGALLATLGAAILGVDPGLVQSIGQTAATAGQAYVAGYSRQQELEADALGVRYLARQGYDPYAQAEFLDNLQAQSALQARIAGRGYDPSRVDFLASHPSTVDRVRQAIAAAGRAGERISGGARNRDAFLAAIDGMTFGDSAEQGLIRGRSFIHPRLRFRFDAPAGWRLSNSPTAVTAAGPGDAQLVFGGARDPGGALDAYIARAWAPQIARQTGAETLQNLRRLSIGGLPAATADLPFRTGKGPFVAQLTVIRTGDALYRFIGFMPQNGSGALRRSLRDAADSFELLSPRQAGRYRPYRIEVVRARSAASIAGRTPFEDFAAERLEVLNGVATGRPPTDGRFKTVTE